MCETGPMPANGITTRRFTLQIKYFDKVVRRSYNGGMASKNRIILIESDSGHRKILGLNLDVYVGCDVVFKHNADAAINFLKKNPDIRLVVSEESVGTEQSILKIYYYVVSAKLDIPIFLSGHCGKLIGKVEMYEKEDWRKMVRACAKILGVTAKAMAQQEVDSFYRISSDTLLAITTAPVDIFAGENLEKIKRLFEEGRGIDRKVARRYFLDHEIHLFVRSGERLRFAEGFSEQVFDFIANDDISPESRIKATGMAFEKTREVVKMVGMSERAIGMAKVTVESIVKIATVSHGLSDFMDILHDSEGAYLYRHSLLVAVVSHQIIGDMNWGNEEQKLKVAFAAFFHDITIPDEKYCRIHSQQELDDCGASENDKAAVLGHAFNAAKLVTNVSDIPFGVDTIIVQHHGSLNGLGFKREEGDGRLSTLATLFLVVEDYVGFLVDAGRDSFDHEQAMEQLKSVHSHGNFAKVAAALGRLKDT